MYLCIYLIPILYVVYCMIFKHITRHHICMCICISIYVYVYISLPDILHIHIYIYTQCIYWL